MTKNKILLVFFALVFCFCSFADCESDRAYALLQIDQAYSNNLVISRKSRDIISAISIAGFISHPSEMTPYLNESSSAAYFIDNNSLAFNSQLGSLEAFISSIDCSATNSAGICPDLSPLVTLLQNINTVLNDCKSDLFYIRGSVNSIDSALSPNNANSFVGNGSDTPSFWLNVKYPELLNSVSNFNDSVHYDFLALSNSLVSVINNQFLLNSSFQGLVNSFDSFVASYLSFRSSVLAYLGDISDYLHEYLPYLESINDSLSYLATNNVVSLDSSVLSNFFSAVNFYQNTQYGDLEFHRKSWKGLGVTDQWSDYPFSFTANFSSANIADILSGGFRSSLISLASLNNYWYWFFDKIKTNELNTAGITAGLSSLSNIASRVDSYVLGDFSNKFNEVVGLMNVIVTNQLAQLTNSNISALSALIETNNIYTVSNNFYLSSIDSKLDVLDYIKILSDTPLADYSGDGDYFDYLTNLYINGSADSGFASTNWFERMEILLASLVFGDSDGTNDIPQGVEMEGVDSSTVETALSDFTYNQEFTGAITALDDTRQSFIGVLNGLHTSIKSVSLPASISIGLGGLDGEDTHNFEDMMHGHFQVSFNTGVADRFTIAVRAVTTISWVLLFFLALWKSGFYLIRKLVYLYRLVTRLLVSVFTR